MCFPSHFLRGIPDSGSQFFHEPDRVATCAFYFEKNPTRDGVWEQSVNWKDDQRACEYTLLQRKTDGSIRFRGGAAILPRRILDRLSQESPPVRGRLSYERCPLLENPYHGNILLDSSVPKATTRMVSADMALHVKRVVTSVLTAP